MVLATVPQYFPLHGQVPNIPRCLRRGLFDPTPSLLSHVFHPYNYRRRPILYQRRVRPAQAPQKRRGPEKNLSCNNTVISHHHNNGDDRSKESIQDHIGNPYLRCMGKFQCLHLDPMVVRH